MTPLSGTGVETPQGALRQIYDLFEGRWPEVLRPILERKNAIIQVMKGYEPDEGNVELK